MAYKVQIDEQALKTLQKLTRKQQVPLWKALERLEQNPRPSRVTSIHGAPALLRLRVGDYRIIYTVRDLELLVLVVKIGHRREVYRRLEDLLHILKRLR